MGKHRVNGYGPPPKIREWRGAEGLARAIDRGDFDHVMTSGPSTELRAMAKRIAEQPRAELTEPEIEAWALSLAEQVAGADD